MAPQTRIPTSAVVLGAIGTVFWCIQLIPLIWQNWRRKKTEGVPGVMMMIWAISSIPFGCYAVVQNFNVPLQIQPQIFGALSLAIWTQILVYSSKWTPLKATAFAAGIFVLFAGLETLLVFTLKEPYKNGLEWPVTAVGVVAVLLLAVGILPPYTDIWRRGGRVVGINFFFLGMDSFGAAVSLFALVAQEHFDILGGTMYIAVAVLEAGIFLSHLIWRFRTRELHKRAKLEGKNFDDLLEARRWQDRRLSSRTHRDDLEAGTSASLDSAANHIPSSTNDEGPSSKEGIFGSELDKEKEEMEKSASTLSMSSEEIVVLDRYDHDTEREAANRTTSPGPFEMGNFPEGRSPSQAHRASIDTESLQQATLQTDLASATATTHEESSINQMVEDDELELAEPRQKEEMKILPIDGIISSGRLALFS